MGVWAFLHHQQPPLMVKSLKGKCILYMFNELTVYSWMFSSVLTLCQAASLYLELSGRKCNFVHPGQLPYHRCSRQCIAYYRTVQQLAAPDNNYYRYIPWVLLLAVTCLGIKGDMLSSMCNEYWQLKCRRFCTLVSLEMTVSWRSWASQLDVNETSALHMVHLHIHTCTCIPTSRREKRMLATRCALFPENWENKIICNETMHSYFVSIRDQNWTTILQTMHS